jgi:CRP-like cAMP-binding protein
MAGLPFFAGCSRPTLLRLGSLFDSAGASAGTLIAATPRWLYVVLDGEAVVVEHGAPAVLRRGDLLGQQRFFGGTGGASPAVALSPLSLLVLSRAGFGAVARCAPGLAGALRASPVRGQSTGVGLAQLGSASVRLALAS